ncbi:endonuclease/exonuclease/phosphatase family protein [Paracoccus sp. EGI L200073]|nr:endonuclease/exonuclease/phosphatase family protein [Paracoccus salsus]
MIETNIWWIRFLDFPRLQFALVTIVLMALYFGLRGHPGRFGWVAIFGAAAALGYHAYKLHPYNRLVEPAVVAQPDCPEGSALRVMIANVKRGNERAELFLDQVAVTEPDLLLVMETDAWWDERLSILDKDFRYRIQSIPDDHSFYGMHLFSKLELTSPEFRFFFGADTPTAVAHLRLSGGEIIGFIGLHPRPPLAFSQTSAMRDAHVLQGALLAREWDAPTILAGDFNAVPWERATRRAMRIGGLLDPRVGRGLFPTYDTGSYLFSWPLDQILFQPQFTLHDFRTLPDFGSDHLAVAATLCHGRGAAQHAPELLAGDLAEAEASIKAARHSISSLDN